MAAAPAAAHRPERRRLAITISRVSFDVRTPLIEGVTRINFMRDPNTIHRETRHLRAE